MTDSHDPFAETSDHEVPAPPIDPAPPAETSADIEATTEIAPPPASDAAPTTVLPPSPVVPAPPEAAAAAGEPLPGPPAAAPGSGSKRGGTVARRVGAGAVIIALAAGAGYGGTWLQNRGDDDSTSSTPDDSTSSLDRPASTDEAPSGEVESVAAEVMPSVVQINVRNGEEGGSGSGVILSGDGQILTNNHVVETAADGGTIMVAFSDGTNAQASILGRDPVTDIAVIQADDVSGLTPAKLGSSADLVVGQDVVAIGSPFGLESTVTQGIVSALNRPVESSDASGDNATVFPAIQTDAAINPGNSGGPLVDLAGNVIGINAAIRTDSSASGSIGLGFAIPIDLARNVAEQLVKGDTVEHARIGVTVTPATEKDELTGIGAEIREVESGGAGDDAGLKAGDIITALDGHPVASSSALVAAVRGHQPGDTVKITYLRDGKSDTVDVKLDSDGGELSSSQE
ncbi:MAG: trypsin-like peptidase domain-containing protein [Aeromicrobium sp.]|uniref:S1C family serine protease n=1 Tax=Aeromicrobium sp. TaxID=1871063 RepID=UPI0039E55D3A